MNAYEQLERRIQTLSQKLETFDTQIHKTTLAISAVEKIQTQPEVLIPVSDGIFTPATLTNTNEFITFVGANTAVTKNKDEMITFLQEELTSLRAYQEKLVTQLQDISKQLDDIHKEEKKDV
ncbi:MAG: prefoldin subunit alpha [Candidatus Woesearchaeota archaeon]